MDPTMIERLEDSFTLLARRGPELIDRFYARLFSRCPALRSLFPRDFSAQKGKLLASLTLVVQNLRSPDKLVGQFREMGARHVDYRTKPEHYPVFRESLVSVMSEMAGPAWNDQLTKDWSTAIDMVSNTMLEGHRRAMAEVELLA